MTGGFLSAKFPELVFGIAGPIGIDIEAITRSLADQLATVAYRSTLVKITDEIGSLQSEATFPRNPTYYNIMRYKMAHASALCRKEEDASYLMKLAMAAIMREREALIASPNPLSTLDDNVKSVVSDVPPDDKSLYMIGDDDRDKVAWRSAYIIRQIKRPEEVKLLRNVYGKQFVLISAYGSESDRRDVLEEKIKLDAHGRVKESRQRYLASKLIELDADESSDEFGQHTRDAFHLADVVIDGIDKKKIKQNLERFISALFGSNETAPTKAEFGMASATVSSMRSSDLSRQVGAAIFSPEGELLAQGCNEVPKAFGGTYWDEEVPDFRDIKIGKDSNDILKIDVLTDLVDRLKRNNILAESVLRAGSPSQIVDVLIGRSKGDNKFEKMAGSLKSAKILDLTEYGRVVHAEMNAICDAARTGVSIKGSRLFTTTFPCHNCTKHILAAGVSEVVFLEPYPKSKAKELHSNEIEIENNIPGKVTFRPFIGITPLRYRDIFVKSKRKKDGEAVAWQHGGPAPMMDIFSFHYLAFEKFAVESLSGDRSASSASVSDLRDANVLDPTGDYNADGP